LAIRPVSPETPDAVCLRHVAHVRDLGQFIASPGNLEPQSGPYANDSETFGKKNGWERVV
jgi:hypothetical protein